MNKISSGVILLASDADERCQLLLRVSDDLVQKGIKAQELIKLLGPVIEGSGGGRPNNAQAGGKAIHKIDDAITLCKQLLKEIAL
jgi:alanyl-tRNA synthetase